MEHTTKQGGGSISQARRENQSVRLPGRSPTDIQYRWRWLLANKWSFIVPDWLIDVFKEHERQHPQIEHIPLLDTGF
jgi:hypothetical protein